MNLVSRTLQIDVETDARLQQMAAERGQEEAALTALRKTFIASIGPDTSETLRANGLEPGLEPSHPKMGILVREAASSYRRARL